MFLKNRNINSKIKRSKVTDYAALNENSYNKTVVDVNFGRHKDLSTLKSDIHLGLAVLVNYHFFWVDNSGLGELSLFRVDKSLCLPQ